MLTSIGDTILEYVLEGVAALLVGWIIMKQQFLKKEYDEIRDDIHNLETEHAELKATLSNVKKNQEIMRVTQQDIQKDIKTLLANTTNKGWFK
jgi:hypothetical protein